MSAEMLQAAIQYAHMGLSVIPLNGKIPMFQNWPEVATRDERIIGKWFHQRPDANLGIATGKKSGVFVVDIDPRHGGDKSWQLEVENHPGKIETWEDITGGGGRHIWFRYPAFAVKNHVGLFPGVDIRGDGGQVVAPPSIHPETHMQYEWDGFAPIQEQNISEAPDWLLAILEPIETSVKPHVECPEKIPHGVQYHTLLSVAGVLRRMGFSAEEITPFILNVHDRRCEKPGPHENMVKMVNNVARYSPHDKQTFKTATKLWRMLSALEHKRAEKEAQFRSIDGYALITQPPNDVRMVIQDCLHVGCTLLVGDPKCGKSWASLGMAVAVATGGKFLSIRDVIRPGRVGYYALEESESRTSKRLRQLVLTPDIALQNIDFIYKLKPMFSGGLDEINLYCERFKPDLIVIDTLMAFVSGNAKGNGSVFREEYKEVKALSDIGAKYDVAVVVVHHKSKAGRNGTQATAGSNGVTGAADSIWMMDRQPQRRAVLSLTGREIEEQEFLMEFSLEHGVGWAVIEEGDDVATTGERQCIIEVLRNGGLKTPLQLSREIGKSIMQTRQILRTMAAANLIVQESNGSCRMPGQGSSNWNEREFEE